MKKYLLFSLCLLFSTASFAQSVKYQGEVEVGYYFGISDSKGDKAAAHMINGARFNQYLSAGLGIGLDYYYRSNESYLSLPLFANVKGYLPISDIVNLYASLDCGYAFSLSGEKSGDVKRDMKGFLISPGFGAGFKVAEGKTVTIGLVYNQQHYKRSYSSGSNNLKCKTLGLKIGYIF